MIEDIMQASFLSFNAFRWMSAKANLKKSLESLEIQKKIETIWLAKREFFLATVSLMSGIGMLSSFLQEKSMVSLGYFVSIFTGLGFFGSALVSSIYLYEHLIQLKENVSLLIQETHPEKKKNMLLEQILHTCKVACFTCFTAWGFFGLLTIFIGKELFSYAMNYTLSSGAFFFLLSFIPPSMLKKMI